jgi:1,4-alpha-glucan branching enzyme
VAYVWLRYKDLTKKLNRSPVRLFFLKQLINKEMSLKKQYNESKPFCKVTFKLPKDIASSAKKVHIAGDFNSWDANKTPMKKLKNGEFTASLELEKGKEYQFRYVLDNSKWVNESEADKYVYNEFQEENSVIVV